jgi:RecB family exonuclease
MDTALFFPGKNDKRHEAEAACARCPVRSQCRESADHHGDENGIWDGELRSRGNHRKQPKPQPEPQETPMQPKTLSASAVQAYLECPARFQAEYIDRARMPSGTAAGLGTACHTATEAWVMDGHYLKDYSTKQAKDVMTAIYDEAYWREFSDAERYDEGKGLVMDWLARQDWSDRTVISTEEKLSFTIKTSSGQLIQFNYIMDRLDKRNDGTYEVVDYKSLMQPLQPEELKQKVQARIYALAIQLQHPEAERIWVTFDMLRYDPVGVAFSRDENRATYVWLVKLVERILADPGTSETLGDGCRYCVRKNVCTALAAHINAGGPLGISDIDEAAKKFYEIDHAIKALELQKGELEHVLLTHMRETEMLEEGRGEHVVCVTVSARRNVDDQLVRAVIGDELMAANGSMTMGKFDNLMKGDKITDSQKAELKRIVTRAFGDPKIKVKNVPPF